MSTTTQLTVIVEILKMKKNNYSDIYLPEDIVTDILLRLPAKSLGRCKCVCRTWYNLIQNPNFINSHYHHPRNRTRLFCFYGNNRSKDDHFVLFEDEFHSKRRQIIDSPTNHNSNGERQNIRRPNVVLGPASGLYFMSSIYSSDGWLALWNPCTTEYRELSLTTFQSPPNRTFFEHRHFGFGSTDKGVKLVIIDGNSLIHEVVLYSLADDCWKDISNTCMANYKSLFLHSSMAIYFNGACYWIAYKNGYTIRLVILFDMTSEVFREVNLPPLLTTMHKIDCTILVRDNSSIVLFVKYCAVNSYDAPKELDMWEMKKEGEWFKVLSFDSSSTYVRLDPYPRWFTTEDEIVIRTNSKFVLYNIKSDETRVLEVDKGHMHIYMSYKDSLTSVRGRSALCKGIQTSPAIIK